MKKLIPVVLAGFAGAAMAGDDIAVYSTDDYCDLKVNKASIADKQYAKAYSDKLGQTPSKKLCNQINAEKKVAENKKAKKKWNYAFNKPYRNSTRRLSQKTIAKLRAAGIDSTELQF